MADTMIAPTSLLVILLMTAIIITITIITMIPPAEVEVIVEVVVAIKRAKSPAMENGKGYLFYKANGEKSRHTATIESRVVRVRGNFLFFSD